MTMNEEKKDGLALRRLRELKRMSRKEACIVLGLNYKTIEKFENGQRVQVRDYIISEELTYNRLV